MKNYKLQAKDIPTEAVLELIDHIEFTESRWTHVSDLEARWPDFPYKVILAKCDQMIRSGLITGCACGCYGGFERY